MSEPVTFAKLTPAHAGEVLTLQRAAFAPEAQAHRDRQTTQAGAYLLVHLSRARDALARRCPVPAWALKKHRGILATVSTGRTVALPCPAFPER